MRAVLSAAIVAMVLAATAAGASSAAIIPVAIKGMAFSPTIITARVGDTIVWSNADFVTHTATARDKSWDVVIAPGKSASLTLTKAEEVEYFCRFHPMMVGKITVGE